jgi:hypothetical protein
MLKSLFRQVMHMSQRNDFLDFGEQRRFVVAPNAPSGRYRQACQLLATSEKFSFHSDGQAGRACLYFFIEGETPHANPDCR